MALASCSSTGPKSDDLSLGDVDRIVVHKSERQMYLYDGRKRVRKYDVSLGFAPEGHKRMEGDGKTPEGRYVIDRRKPDSMFHLALGISYPDENDIRKAQSLGVDPGGEIFIHGQRNGTRGTRDGDWTAGCIAVSNPEMEEIYQAVRVGTPVYIYR